jgi:hypothetical protein
VVDALGHVLLARLTGQHDFRYALCVYLGVLGSALLPAAALALLPGGARPGLGLTPLAAPVSGGVTVGRGTAC